MQKGIGKIDLVDQHRVIAGDLRLDEAERVENRGTVAGRGIHHVVLVLHRIGGWVDEIRVRRRQHHDFRPLVGQRLPPVGVLHVKADLDADSSEIAVKNGEQPPRGDPLLQHLASLRRHRVHFPVYAHHAAFAVHQHRHIAVSRRCIRLLQEHGHHQVTVMPPGTGGDP